MTILLLAPQQLHKSTCTALTTPVAGNIRLSPPKRVSNFKLFLATTPTNTQNNNDNKAPRLDDVPAPLKPLFESAAAATTLQQAVGGHTTEEHIVDWWRGSHHTIIRYRLAGQLL